MCVASWFLSLVEDGLYKGCVKFVYKMCAFVDEMHVGCVRSGCLMSLSYCVFDLCNTRQSLSWQLFHLEKFPKWMVLLTNAGCNVNVVLPAQMRRLVRIVCWDMNKIVVSMK